MLKKLYLIGGLLISVIGLNAQEDKSSGELLQEGIEQHDQGNYDKALQAYRKVAKADTNYLLALYEQSLSLYRKKEYEKCIEVCNKGLLYNRTDNRALMLQNKANALDDMDKGEEAIKVYDELIKDFPYHYIYHYNKGITLIKLKKYQNALEELEKSISLNPYHGNSYYRLGMLAKQEGKKTLATLYLSISMILNLESDNSGVLDQLSNNLIGDDEVEDNKLNFGPVGDDFSALDAKLTSGAGTNASYKFKSSFSKIKMVRQIHYMMSNLKKDDKGFASDKFVPFFKEILSTGKFDEFVSFLLIHSQSREVSAKAAKKLKSASKSFMPFMTQYWKKTASAVTITSKEGKSLKGYYIFTNPDALLSRQKLLGFSEKMSATGTYSGYTETYTNGGAFDEYGQLNASNKREGLWKGYYRSGVIKNELNYKNGQADGLYKSYNEQGNLILQYELSKGELTGEAKSYFPNGKLKWEGNYSTEGKEGLRKEYYGTGELYSEGKYEKGKATGLHKTYWPNGKLKNEENYKNGEYNGVYKSYSEEGKLIYLQEFKEGKRNGKSQIFYEVGTLESEGSYVNDNPSGELKEYYSEGPLKQTTSFDVSGKKNGKVEMFTVGGRKYFEIVFEKGVIKSYTYFDSSNNPKYTGKANGNKIDYKLYYPDGVLSMEGKFEGESRTGVWKYYDRYGQLESESVYTNDKKEGSEKEFDSYSGKVTSKIKYEKGDKTGQGVAYFTNGNLKAKGNYNADEKVGVWKYYYMNGNLKSEQFESNPNGNYTISSEFAISGKKTSETLFDGKQNEVLTYVFDSAGILYDTVAYIEAGKQITYYPNGKVKSEMQIENGLKHGIRKAYYPNGNLASEGQYVLNKAHGTWKWYYPNGKLSSEGNYYYGERHGVWKWNHENGKTSSEHFYNHGNPTGLHKDFHENGNLRETTIYDSFGHMNGPRDQFDLNGQLQIQRIYERDKLISYSYLGKDNKPITPILLNNASGHVVAYYPNGKVSREFTIKKGNIEGSYKVYHKNGNYMDTFYNKGNNTEGFRTWFFENGKIWKQCNYSVDEENGSFTEYHANGQKKQSGTYVYGSREGWWFEYDSNGKQIAANYFMDDEVLYSY